MIKEFNIAFVVLIFTAVACPTAYSGGDAAVMACPTAYSGGDAAVMACPTAYSGGDAAMQDRFTRVLVNLF